jgi:predicted RNase H-like HicB family nuclease
MKVDLKKTKQNYPVLVEKTSDGFYFVQCPIIEDCYSEGKTVKAALANIKEIIELRIEEGVKPKFDSFELSVQSVAV